MLEVYRKLLKPIPGIHGVVYPLCQNVAIPTLERLLRFRTLADDPLWFRYRLLTGSYEIGTRRVVQRLVQTGMIACDIGAHVGYYTTLFARLVGAEGRVHAFEPNPRTFSVLAVNTRRYLNVELHNVAVAEASGEAVLHDRYIESGGASLFVDQNRLGGADLNGELAPRAHVGAGRDYAVRCIRLDDYLDATSVYKVDIIKMDIEGAELSALRGMRKLIGRSPGLRLIIEYFPVAASASGNDPSCLLDYLWENFNRIDVIMDDGLTKCLTGNRGRSLLQDLIKGRGRVNLLCMR